MRIEEDNEANLGVGFDSTNDALLSPGAISATAQKLVYAADRLLKVYPDMTVLQAQVFLFIAANPGTPQHEVVKHLRSQAASTVSRAMALLSDIGSRGQEGLGLIKYGVNPVDRREKLMWLSPKGRRLLNEIGRDLAPSLQSAPDRLC